MNNWTRDRERSHAVSCRQAHVQQLASFLRFFFSYQYNEILLYECDAYRGCTFLCERSVNPKMVTAHTRRRYEKKYQNIK
jgi:hypothetical protein